MALIQARNRFQNRNTTRHGHFNLAGDRLNEPSRLFATPIRTEWSTAEVLYSFLCERCRNNRLPTTSSESLPPALHKGFTCFRLKIDTRVSRSDVSARKLTRIRQIVQVNGRWTLPRKAYQQTGMVCEVTQTIVRRVFGAHGYMLTLERRHAMIKMRHLSRMGVAGPRSGTQRV